MRLIDDVRARLDSFPQGLLQLVMRFSIFWVFWRAGTLKLASMDQALVLFREEYKVPLLSPAVALWLATVVEIGAPCLILLGLCARLATLPLIALTLVIQLFVYWNDYPSHLPWLAILLFILVRGPGPWSLDALLIRKRR